MNPLNTPIVTCLSWQDPAYPKRLRDLFDPPKAIYIEGDIELLKLPMIAIVGARAASPNGLQNALFFAQGLARAGALVVSGLARGIDGAAHRGALGEKPYQATLAVCGTGLDLVYPPEHVYLANCIRNKGLLLSELPPGVGPKAFHFPRRNRLIAALALGVVVIEAANKSGSLITARLALEMGREVFAVPGAINNPLSQGCHQLIQQGAKLVCRPEEVLEELYVQPKSRI
ncbi:DNA processing protein [Polynucleobacter meluiroseus]|jgi:DNA processing protein|uniref:DNA processing protein n=1 Tax=Polynucleobacter meluiroseus TaxID=1938814 RepID=A0A240E023_9BURK|nr:DNA-processing protein DprA [Polynucleobacter meluiroseus]SNX28788.1 DNA processing protein [Polynucleobacter meluiroseus]